MDTSYPRCDRLPVSVSFLATYNCNTMCEHCDTWRHREEELTFGEARGMVRELKKLGTRHITFDGGEPLTRADIGELVGFCASEGVMTALNTNGLLVNERLSDLMRVGRLNVSLYWADGLAGAERGYQKSLEAICSAKKAGIKVEARLLLTRANISALPAILDDCSSAGVCVAARRVERQEGSADNSRIGSVIPGRAELDEALRYLAERRRKGACIIVPFVHAGPGAASGCLSEERTFVISPSGDVAPCSGLLGLKKWPNGRSLGFRAAFRKAGEFYCPSEAFARRQASNL